MIVLLYRKTSAAIVASFWKREETVGGRRMRRCKGPKKKDKGISSRRTAHIKLLGVRKAREEIIRKGGDILCEKGARE